jgi:hypothetical protein
LLALKTVTFIYDIREDRILAAINAGDTDSWSCWLTRRMALALLAKADEFLSKTSKLLQNATAETREQLISFEREAALVQTAGSVKRTPNDVILDRPRAAELLHEVTLNQRGTIYEIILKAEVGRGSVATVNRAELQRIMQMMRDVAAKANWELAQGKSTSEKAPRTLPH